MALEISKHTHFSTVDFSFSYRYGDGAWSLSDNFTNDDISAAIEYLCTV